MKMITVFAVMMFASVAAFGQTSSLEMISSRAALKAYALEKIVWANASVSSPSMVNFSSTRPFVEIKNSDGEIDTYKLGLLIWNNTLVFDVANPKDPLWFYVQYSDKNRDVLFCGSRETELEQQNGCWRLPGGSQYIEVDLAYQIPIEVDGLSGARAITRDENGEILNQEYLRIDDRGGKFYFPTNLAGQNGELILTYYRNGSESTQVFGLSNGKVQNIQRFATSTWTSFKDIWSFGPDPFSIRMTFDPSREIPLLTAKFTKEASVNLYGGLYTGVIAKGVYIREARTGNVNYYQLPRVEYEGVTVPFKTGDYFIIFDFEGDSSSTVPSESKPSEKG